MDKLVEIKDLAVSYYTYAGEVQAVRGISFDIENGKTTALVGESGPDHDKRFEVEVSLNGRVIGTGSGSSKKRAEQMAAQSALENLK